MPGVRVEWLAKQGGMGNRKSVLGGGEECAACGYHGERTIWWLRRWEKMVVIGSLVHSKEEVDICG